MCNSQYPLSIITVSLNSEKSIERTLISISEQFFSDFELIVIDGASTDGTLGIVRKYQGIINMKVISEPDGGIYDAMNKGICMAKGNVIGFLHADDQFANEFVLTNIHEKFVRNFELSAVYGDLNYIQNNESNSVFRAWKSCLFTRDLLKKGWMPPHPTLYVRRECFKKLKGFNTNYKISSDYDFILRLFSNRNYITHYIPKVLVNMSVGGTSNRSFINIIQKSLEDFNILRCNGFSITSSLTTLFFKNVSKLHQFLH